MSTLISLTEANDRERRRWSHGKGPLLNGIACPVCGKELMDVTSHVFLTSAPPQLRTKCSECNYTGLRTVAG